MPSQQFHNSIRKYHRILGFFLAGIMGVYALSGTLLIFRPTDFLKYPTTEIRQLAPEMKGAELSSKLRLRGFAIKSETDDVVIFNSGQYDKNTGETVVNKMDYPAPLAKMVELHKSTNKSPLFFLNIFFGMSLLFFVISSFFMFMPKVKNFKQGLKISLGGAAFAILVIIFAS